jgi:GTP pyrophosphokinase
LTGQEVLATAFPELRSENHVADDVAARARNGDRNEFAVPIRGLIPGMAVHLGTCCHPLPGDQIIGISATGKGLTIHTTDCETLANFVDVPEQWVDVHWEPSAGDGIGGHVGRLLVTLANRPGALAALTGVIGRGQGNISNLKISDRSPDFFELQIDVEVSNVDQLGDIIAGLRAEPAVGLVERERG